MPIEYVPYFPQTIQGQAVLNNFIRTRRRLSYRDHEQIDRRIARGMPRYELETLEDANNPPAENPNLVIRGECLSACAYLKEKGIHVDLVYIDPPFASGADYAKQIHIRRNPKVAAAIANAETKLPDDELQGFEEKMYGDIWTKEDYLNWMYENLMAIKAVMAENASIYVHLDWHIGHYVKVLMDEVFGEDNFQREIIWDFTVLSGFKVQAANWIRGHDSIFYYTRSEQSVFNKLKQPHTKEYKAMFKPDKNGRLTMTAHGVTRYWEEVEPKGKPYGDVWDDIMSFQQQPTSQEKVDYATQKPEALLERIIAASSNEGMVVADFFGGSGVTAAVSHRLKRRFIHVDVGLNATQTTRDRLHAAGAAFRLLDVKDGVALFRNPVQTMEKLRSLITGLRLDEAELDGFWAGAFNDTRHGLVPVYLPDLKDHTTKILDIPLINQIINGAMPDLPEKVKKVVVYYVDIENPDEVNAFIKDNKHPDREIELRDLKELLAEIVVDDQARLNVAPDNTLTVQSFHSDRLQQKIAAYNTRHGLNLFPDGELLDPSTGRPPKPKPVKDFKPIEISEDGLELIEWISADCTAAEGPWHSDAEIKLDKLGNIMRDGKKTKEPWNATLPCPNPPLRVKIRSIAGDETIFTDYTPPTKPNPQQENVPLPANPP